MLNKLKIKWSTIYRAVIEHRLAIGAPCNQPIIYQWTISANSGQSVPTPIEFLQRFSQITKIGF